MYDKSPTLIKIEAFRRQELKLLLDQCTAEQKLTFKRMYSHKNLELPIDDVVDKMPRDKVDWAICQAETSATKNKSLQPE